MRPSAPLVLLAALLVVASTTAVAQDELPADALYGEIQWNEYESFLDIHADLDTAWDLLLAALAPVTEDGAVERPESGWLNVGDIWALAESLPYRDDVWSRVRVRVGSMVTTDQWARAEAVLNSVASLLDERVAYEEWLASGEAAESLYGSTDFQEYYDSGYGLAGLALPVVAWYGGGGYHGGGCGCYDCKHDDDDDDGDGSQPDPDGDTDPDSGPDIDPDIDPDIGPHNGPDREPGDRFGRRPEDAGTVVHVSDLARRLNAARQRRATGDRAGGLVPGPEGIRPGTASLLGTATADRSPTPITTRIVRPVRPRPTLGRTSLPTADGFGRTRPSSYRAVGRSNISTLLGSARVSLGGTTTRSIGRNSGRTTVSPRASAVRTSAGRVRSAGRSSGRSSGGGRSSGRSSRGGSSGGRGGR